MPRKATRYMTYMALEHTGSTYSTIRLCRRSMRAHPSPQNLTSQEISTKVASRDSPAIQGSASPKTQHPPRNVTTAGGYHSIKTARPSPSGTGPEKGLTAVYKRSCKRRNATSRSIRDLRRSSPRARRRVIRPAPPFIRNRTPTKGRAQTTVYQTRKQVDGEAC